MINKNDITGLILAGGAGRRVQNKDKGLLKYSNKPMIEHQISILQPQVKQILISANRNLNYYESLGFKVIPDLEQGFQGPLVGICQGLANCTTSHLFVQPVDMPNLPDNIIERILKKINTSSANQLEKKCSNYYLKSSEREHYLSLLISRDKLTPLKAFLSQNKKRVSEFLESSDIQSLDLELSESFFSNLNQNDDYRE